MNFLSIIAAFFLLSSAFTHSLDALVKEDVLIIDNENNRTGKRKGKIALCAIFKDEAPYLKEWIEFHRLIGVSHFYLYNNCSTDDFWGVLKPYVEKGIIELFDVPFDSSVYNDGAKTHNFVQVCCYNHAINLAKDYYKWLAIIDADEFICPVKDPDLPTVLQQYNYAAGLVLYWQIYGTSHVWELQPGELLIEKLVLRQPDTTYAQFKSIVQPKYAESVDPHCCTFSSGYSVSPDHQRFSHTRNFSRLPVDVIRINHYTYRTDSFYQNVKKPRRSQWGDNPSPEQEKTQQDWANSINDPVMLRFVPKLKKHMLAGK